MSEVDVCGNDSHSLSYSHGIIPVPIPTHSHENTSRPVQFYRDTHPKVPPHDDAIHHQLQRCDKNVVFLTSCATEFIFF